MIMTRANGRPMRLLKLALTGALALGLALAVSGCGRKGPVEPPAFSQS